MPSGTARSCVELSVGDEIGRAWDSASGQTAMGVARRRIFLSYRRDDTRDVAGRLHDHLAREFGADAVFEDVAAMPAGADFRKHLALELADCEVVLVLVGQAWLGPRLHEPDDVLAMEIAIALRDSKWIVPVLVSGASMPKEADLPEALRPIAALHALVLRSDPDFQTDLARLIAALRARLGPRRSMRGTYAAGLVALVLFAGVAAALAYGRHPDDPEPIAPRIGAPRAQPAPVQVAQVPQAISQDPPPIAPAIPRPAPPRLHPAPPPPQPQHGRVVVHTEDGAEVSAPGVAPQTAHIRRRGENARAVLELPAGEQRIRCRIPGELDPVATRVTVVADEEIDVDCFAN